MTRNVGSIDRALRILVGLVLIVAALLGQLVERRATVAAIWLQVAWGTITLVGVTTASLVAADFVIF